MTPQNEIKAFYESTIGEILWMAADYRRLTGGI